MNLEFAKYHGIGNDFILINGLSSEISLEADVIANLCDRHFGIGADGLIFVRPSSVADVFMDYYNADGSEAEMCGNGIRCLSMYIWDEHISDSSTLSIETRAGIKQTTMVSENGVPIGASVDMGEPTIEHVINQPLLVDGEEFRATCLSMGNPHCVLFVENIAEAPVTTLGPKIETSSYFPNRTNVEFAQIIDNSTIMLRVWERGCGETLACGTGACATIVAAALVRSTDRRTTVKLPGGDLHIEWLENNHIIMSGPAVGVFKGIIALTDSN